MVVERFYENVERLDEQGRPYNAVLEFTPGDGREMIVACLWSRWVDPAGKEPDAWMRGILGAVNTHKSRMAMLVQFTTFR